MQNYFDVLKSFATQQVASNGMVVITYNNNQ